MINGTIDATDAVAEAEADTTSAYEVAAGAKPVTPETADLGGKTLVAGVYSAGAMGLTGTVTLNAQGNPNAVFIFQAASTLITKSSSVVALIGDANACNVYWQVSSSATLGTGSVFVGTILALASISANTGATIDGRLLARTGAVTLDDNAITNPSCATVSSTPPTTIATPVATTTPVTTKPVTTIATPAATVAAPTTTTTRHSTVSTVRTTSPTVTGGLGGGGSTIGTLPTTGFNLALPLTLGLGAVLLGALILAISRRRDDNLTES